MVSWTLVPCLTVLRDEFNNLAPNRSKRSDGSIGDSAHQDSSSDHNPDETGSTPHEDSDSKNEVHAIDVDADLNLSGWTMEKAVDIIVDRHRRGLDNRLQNIIYNRRIWSESWGWSEREYTGSNPHDQHAHFSSRYPSEYSENTKPWGLLERGIMLLPKQGEKGEGVRYWQYVLTRIGYQTLVVDGEYGPKTATAIKDFWLKTTLPKDPNAFNGSYLSGYLAMKMHQKLAVVSVPKPDPVPITQEQINNAVRTYFEENIGTVGFDVSGDFDGKVTIR